MNTRVLSNRSCSPMGLVTLATRVVTYGVARDCSVSRVVVVATLVATGGRCRDHLAAATILRLPLTYYCIEKDKTVMNKYMNE